MSMCFSQGIARIFTLMSVHLRVGGTVCIVQEYLIPELILIDKSN